MDRFDTISINPEDLDVDFVIILPEKNSNQCLKFLTQIIIKKTKMDWQVFEMFCQRKTSELTYLDDFFLPFVVLFSKTDQGKLEGTSSQTQCLVFKILQHYIGEIRLSVLLVLNKKTFSTRYICLLTSWRFFVMCDWFRMKIDGKTRPVIYDTD